MAKKPVRKPGRPAKRAPKVKVQRFAKGEEVFAQDRGLGQDPVSQRIQSGVDKTRAAVSRGINAIGETAVQAPADPLTANAVARARSGQGYDSLAAGAPYREAVTRGAQAAKDAYLNWYNQNKGVANPSPSAEVTSADMGGAPASGYGAVPQGILDHLGATWDEAKQNWNKSAREYTAWNDNVRAAANAVFPPARAGELPYRGAPPAQPPVESDLATSRASYPQQNSGAPAQPSGLISAEDAQVMGNAAMVQARTPSAPDANGWVSHKGPVPERIPSPGATSNQGAFRADGSAIPVPSSKNVNTVSSGNFGVLASGNTQADYDNALLRKWYSLAPNERGAMPPSVMEAKYRGATNQDTAMNIARARIMESGLPPERISESLGKLEQIRAYLEAQTANTAHQGRQDEMQAARDTETGRHNQATEGLTREQQQAQADYNQGRLSVEQWNAALAAANAQRDADFNQQKLGLMGRELAQKETPFIAIPALDPTINEKASPVQYKQMVDAQQRAMAAQMDWYRLMGEHPGASQQELEQLALTPVNGKLRAAAQYFDPNYLARRQPSGYAGGGMVQSPVYAGPPSLPRIDPIMADYRQYVLRAQQQGVPTVPFDQFAQLKAGSFQGQPQQPVAMARGGAVPAAGKMVIDTNPNAKTDSIPAVIDGKSPARLDSGEFVIPADVVRHYGTKFLHGLIEKANGAA